MRGLTAASAKALFGAALVALFALPAAAQGYLSVRQHPEIEERDGAASAEFFVYDERGERVASGRPNGAFAAGEAAEVAEGWYFVEVGRFRAAENLRRIYVADGHVSVVPTGWISVETDAPGAQPSAGCSPWNAELSVFTLGEQRALVQSNSGSGVQTWGAVQVLAGESALVFFNGFPAVLMVSEDGWIELPTGYQDPIAGERPQLSTGPEGADDAIRRPLCEDGGLHVPAGRYHASAILPIATHPYERREWTVVDVEVFGTPETRTVRANALAHPRWEGEGARPVMPGPEHAAAVERITGGGGPRLGGFGR